MSDLRIARRSRSHSVVIGTAVADSSSVRFDDAAGGVVIFGGVPSSAATAIDCYGSEDAITFRRIESGRITLARQQAQVCETITTSSGTTTANVQVCTAFYTGVAAAYSLPDAIFPNHVIRLVADAALGAVDATVCIKS
jgi:hypothetical protein